MNLAVDLGRPSLLGWTCVWYNNNANRYYELNKQVFEQTEKRMTTWYQYLELQITKLVRKINNITGGVNNAGRTGSAIKRFLSCFFVYLAMWIALTGLIKTLCNFLDALRFLNLSWCEWTFISSNLSVTHSQTVIVQ